MSNSGQKIGKRTALPLLTLMSAPLMALVAITPAYSADSTGAEQLEGFSGIWEIARREEREQGRRGERGERPSRGENRGGARPQGDGQRRGPPAINQTEGPDVEGLGQGDLRIYGMMTPAGRAVFDAMDPHDLPANNCLSNGLPSLVGIPDVQEWSVDGDVLTIHYANFNAVRTIYLDGRAQEGGASHFGHSTGEFSDDGFIVTTSGLTATLGGLARNAPGSASRIFVERYSLSDDGTQITGMLTIRDPEYLTQELRRPIAFSRAAEGVTVPEIGCSVEASQRYLSPPSPAD